MTAITIASVSREAKTLILGKENPEMRISQLTLSETSTSLLAMKISTMMIHSLISHQAAFGQRSDEQLKPPLIEPVIQTFLMFRAMTSVDDLLKDFSSTKASIPG
jgi:hypothetical protein